MVIAMALLLIFFLTLTGLTFLFLISRNYSNPEETLSLALPSGLGITIFLLLSLSVFGDFKNIFTFLVIATLVLAFIIRERLISYFSSLRKRFSVVYKLLSLKNILLFIITSFIIGGVFFINTWPIADWDALASYDFLARVYYLSDSLNPFQKGINILDPGLGRPPFTSVMYDLTYWIFGFGNQGRFFNSLLLLSFFAILFINFREKFSSTISGVFSLLIIIATPLLDQSMIAYTNFPFSMYLVLALIYFQKWLYKNISVYLIVALLFFFISLTVRQEFFIFHFFTAFIFLALGLKKKKLILVAIACLVLTIGGLKLWKIIADFHLSRIDANLYLQFLSEKGSNLTYNKRDLLTAFTGFDQHNFSRIWEVIPLIWQVLTETLKFQLFLLLVILFLYGKKILEVNLFMFLWIILALIGLIGGVYIFTFTFPEDWFGVKGSAQRMISFLPPIIIYYFFSLLKPNFLKEFIEEVKSLWQIYLTK